MRATTLLVPALLLAACASPAATAPPGPSTSAATAAAAEAPAEGWRWESDSPLRARGARSDGEASIVPDDVTSVAICRYALRSEVVDTSELPAPILSSTLLQDDDARALVTALGTGPEGGGPNAPQNCSEGTRLGAELVVLEVATLDGHGQVVVRYSGCDGHGTDDGTVVRRQTRDVLTQVLAGPHAPTTLSGDVALLWQR